MSRLHDLVRNDPRYVDLVRRRTELEDRRRAHDRRIIEEQEKFREAHAQYMLDLSRAIGDEEIASLTPPAPPAHIERRNILAAHDLFDGQRQQLDEDEAELFAVFASEYAPALVDRKRELRDEAQELLRPVLGQLRTIVNELNDVRTTEQRLRRAAWKPMSAAEVAHAKREFVAAGGDPEEFSAPARPRTVESVSIESVLASIVNEPVVPKERGGLIPDWAKRKLAREEAKQTAETR